MSEINKSDEDAAKELDVGSEHFNPLRALYAVDYKVTEKTPKVLYQNLAAFETALTKFGIWNLNKRPKPINNVPSKATDSKSASGSLQVAQPEPIRRFAPHQMAITGTAKKKHQRNLFIHMEKTEGPLALLNKYLHTEDNVPQIKIRIYVRKDRGIGGTVEGDLVAFDKQWNLLLKNVIEVWRRRKYKYGDQNICGEPSHTDYCNDRLHKLGIALPELHVKSVNRKNVELRREIPQLMVRGENVVSISCISK